MSMRDFVVNNRLKNEGMELASMILGQLNIKLPDKDLSQFLDDALEHLPSEADKKVKGLVVHPDDEDYVSRESAVTAIAELTLVYILESMILGFLSNNLIPIEDE